MAGRITGDESLEELQDLVAKLQKDVNWLLEGNLSSKNVREIGGYQVSSTLFQAKGGDVGMSSANAAGDPDPVRFWAGSVDKDNAPWRVYKSGKSVMTGALIQSKDGTYPLVKLDPANDLIGAYASATTSITVNAYKGATARPYLLFKTGAWETDIDQSALGLFSIMADGDVKIGGDTIYLVGEVWPTSLHVSSWYNIIRSSTSPSTLQDELDGKATSGRSTGFSGGHNHGIPDGTMLAVAGGGSVMFSSAPQHTHAQLA